jgi:hypothetical protein
MSNGKICELCSQLNLSYYHTNQGTIPASLSLGSLDELRQRSIVCDLCAVVYGLPSLRNYKSGPPDYPLPPKSVELKPWELGIGVYAEANGATGEQQRFLGDLTVYAYDPTSPAELEGGGRFVSGLLLKHLLHSCETKHGDTCNVAPHLAKNRDSVTLLLLDVEKQRLVPFDLSSGCRYVALSYVWGTVQMLHTTRENLFTLMQEGALDRMRNELPRVVQDAINLVSLLGERYLWVDAISIVQDDPVWKHQQISQMDLIYSNSILTIIGMSTTNANDTLSGIPPHARLPTLAQLQGLVVTRPTSSLEDALRSSVYDTRAWTLQEKVLATRCLFVSDEQVFFRCSAGIQRETEKVPSVTLTSSASISKTNSVNPFARMNQLAATATAKASEGSLLWSKDFYHYTHLLEDYTSRQLSYQGDLLLAFSGIQTRFMISSGGDFICGLPEVVFDQALLWVPKGKRILDRRTDPVSLSSSISIQAPSWSWTGWHGPVENVLSNSMRLEDLIPSIQRFEIYGPNVRRSVQRHPARAGDPEREAEELAKLRVVGECCVDSSPFQTYFLVFETDTIQLKRFRVFERSLLTRTLANCGKTGILDENGKGCGVFFNKLPNDIYSDVSALSLIALSHWKYNLHSEWALTEYFGINTYSYNDVDPSLKYEWESRILVVMLVKWIPLETRVGVRMAERVAIGSIHVNAWVKSSPQSVVVSLA